MCYAIAQKLYKLSHHAFRINHRTAYNISADNEFAYYCNTRKLFLCKLLHLPIATSLVITGFLLFHMCVTHVRKQRVTLLSLEHREWRPTYNGISYTQITHTDTLPFMLQTCF